MSTRVSLRVLQIILGGVLCALSVKLVMAELHAPHRGHAFFVLLILGIVEAVAALVFLFAAQAGGWALLLTLAFAVVLHVLHGEVSHVGILAIYAAGVLAVMSGERG